MSRGRRLVCLGSLLVCLACAPGCVSENVKDVAHDVLTLRTGTISALKDMRGQGPFHMYPVPPAEMLEVVAAACRKAVGVGNRPPLVSVSERALEVTAKELEPDAPKDPGYSQDWRSAVVVIIHPDPRNPSVSRVEWNACRRSSLLGYRVDWMGSLPGWIDEALRERAAGAKPPAGS